MSKQSETGHAKNVGNFGVMVSYCSSYGPVFNPFRDNIKLPALIILHSEADLSLQAVIDGVTNYNQTINIRKQTFEGLKPLSTRLISALQATDATPATIDDAKGFNRKIQGTRATAIKESMIETLPDGTIVNHSISSSQQSYDQQIQHFSKLISLLAAEASYSPNEVALQVATLNDMLSNMRTCNTNIGIAYANITQSRITRNNLLYNETTGICSIAADVKKYVKSIYNPQSTEFKMISKLKFTSLR
jgi:hypothetical protein